MMFWILLACVSKKLQMETFETTWTVVNETFPYEDFNGTDWDQVYETYQPLAKKSKTPDELRPVLHDMLAELNVSHMAVIPAEEYSLLDANAASDSTDSNSDASEEDDASDKIIDQGWVGLSARWIESQLIVTSVDGQDGVQMGWAIDSINGISVESRATRFSDSEPRKKSFYMGRFAEGRFYGDVHDTVDIVFTDSEGQAHERSLIYEKGAVMTTGVALNLPSTGVSFVHQQLESGIDRIAFTSFMMPIRDPMTQAFDRIAKSESKGLIIDLRGNPGGVIGLAQYLSSYLISEKDLDLGEQISRDGNMFLVIHPRPKALQYTGPVAVLVDEMSASTSEVFAGGTQELGRVKVFGQQTAGKALPSGVRKLPNGDRLQYVLSDLKTPSGGRYEENVVTPDYPIVRTRADYLGGIDPEMTAAVKWITEQSKTEDNQQTGDSE